jgi:hypothetical protein
MLHFSDVCLSLLEGSLAVWLSTQFRDVARHQWIICFRIFVGTYCLYHDGSDITSQKNGLLEYYHTLFYTFKNIL